MPQKISGRLSRSREDSSSLGVGAPGGVLTETGASTPMPRENRIRAGAVGIAGCSPGYRHRWTIVPVAPLYIIASEPTDRIVAGPFQEPRSRLEGRFR